MMPPATKLFQVRKPRMTRIAALQNISNVLMERIYSETAKPIMGIIPRLGARDNRGMPYRCEIKCEDPI
jgi:hypothetical protein